MEQGSEAASTSSSGDVDASETVVIKIPTTIKEENDITKEEKAEQMNEEQQAETVDVAATIKIEKQISKATDDTESEYVIVEDLEETESESEKEETQEIEKPSIDCVKIDEPDRTYTSISEKGETQEIEKPSIDCVKIDEPGRTCTSISEKEETQEIEEPSIDCVKIDEPDRTYTSISEKEETQEIEKPSIDCVKIDEPDRTCTSISEKGESQEIEKRSIDCVKKDESVTSKETEENRKEVQSIEAFEIKADEVAEQEAEEEEVVTEEEVEEENKDKVDTNVIEKETTNEKEEQVAEKENTYALTNENEIKIEANTQLDGAQQSKQENVNKSIKEIISDIDSNIREQERISSLKQEELRLLQKQQELAQQIQEQQMLAERLASQNNMLQQQFQQQQQKPVEMQSQQYAPSSMGSAYRIDIPSSRIVNSETVYPLEQQQQTQHKSVTMQKFSPPQKSVSRYSTFEETKDGNTITKKTESYESQESSNVTKHIDLQKIFTPATDAEEILPRNRKLYASSAFYSPGLHPTVEDQVELARRISHSLSDISNQQSKGQSMYVNRKKRSVKWVHEGGQGEHEQQVEEYSEEQFKENTEQLTDAKRLQEHGKIPLRFLMNPRGQVRDYNSLRDSLNTKTGLLSPEKCAELVTALQTQKGRGAELFAKRRKKAEKWIVDEQNASTQNPSGLPDYHSYPPQVPPKPPTSPSIVPAYSDAGKHRVQLNLHQEQVLEKYARPGLQVVKSPWEAALETGSASTAFVEGPNARRSKTPTPSPAPLHEVVYSSNAYSTQSTDVQKSNIQTKYTKPSSYNDHQRDLAYKPNLPQGWKAPSVSLPKELYMPKEIPLESYAPPPVANLKPSAAYSPIYQDQAQPHTWTPAISPAPATISPSPYSDYNNSKFSSVEYGSTNFPFVNKAAPKPVCGGGGSIFPISTQMPPKQQYWEPTSYQKVQPQSSAQKGTQVNFNPSPLPYDKLAKFENHDNSGELYQQQPRYLAPNYARGSRIRNISPARFGAKSPLPTQYSPPLQQYSNRGSTSYTPSIPSSTPVHGHYNTNELLHGQTFNNSARGWKNTSFVNSHFGKQRAPLTNGCDMPYTDF